MSGTGFAPNCPADPGCARCGAAICDHADALYAGVVTIDTGSEPGAWAQHLRDTACMRNHGPAPSTLGVIA